MLFLLLLCLHQHYVSHCMLGISDVEEGVKKTHKVNQHLFLSSQYISTKVLHIFLSS